VLVSCREPWYIKRIHLGPGSTYDWKDGDGDMSREWYHSIRRMWINLYGTPPSPTSASSASWTSSVSATADDGTTPLVSKNVVDNSNGIDSVEVTTPAVVDDNDSSTTITVKGESEGAMSSLSSSSSSSQQQQGQVVGKVALVATATATGIALFL